MKIIKKILALSFILIMIFNLVACEKKVEQKDEADKGTKVDTKIITDMTGRQVEIKYPINSVIVNQWDFGEVISLLIGEKYPEILKGVGRSGSAENFKRVYGGKYPQLNDISTIGGGGKGSYDTEQIIKLNPDVFFINSSGRFLEDSLKQVKDLEKAGIPILVFTMGDNPTKSPQQAISILGEVFDKKEKAEEIINFINDQFALLKERKVEEVSDKATIYYEHSRGVDRNTFGTTLVRGGWASIIEKAGGKNIAIDNIGENNQLAPEFVLKSDPDHILFSSALGYVTKETDGAPALAAEVVHRTGWDKLQAIKEKNLHVLFHDHSRTPFAFYPTLYLAKSFYPELMEGVNPDEILKEFYDRFMIVKYDDGIWSYKIN